MSVQSHLAWWTTGRRSGRSFLELPAEPLLSPNMHRSTETGTNAHPIVQELRRQLCPTERWEGNTPQNSRAPVARLRIPGQQTLCPAGFAWIPRVARLAECLPLKDPPA